VLAHDLSLVVPSHRSRCKLTGSQKPGLYDKAELSRGALSLEHLLGVVPSHSSAGGTASNKDDFTLFISGRHFVLLLQWGRIEDLTTGCCEEII
jgi:hypothetical protein